MLQIVKTSSTNLVWRSSQRELVLSFCDYCHEEYGIPLQFFFSRLVVPLFLKHFSHDWSWKDTGHFTLSIKCNFYNNKTRMKHVTSTCTFVCYGLCHLSSQRTLKSSLTWCSNFKIHEFSLCVMVLVLVSYEKYCSELFGCCACHHPRMDDDTTRMYR